MLSSLPGIGPVTYDSELHWYVSEPVETPLLGGPREYVVDGYEPELADSLEACVDAFRSLQPGALRAGEQAIYEYYLDTAQEIVDPTARLDPGSAGPPAAHEVEEGFPQIGSPAEVWEHITASGQVHLVSEDGTWYVSLECECSWEPEHGLAIVLRQGLEVSLVGPFEGRVTDPDLPGGVLYRRLYA